jgi:dUTP diphosphatase
LEEGIGMALRVKKLEEGATLPTVGHPGEDLAYDLYAMEDTVLYPGAVVKVRTGIAAQFSSGQKLAKFGLLIRDRSSMAAKGITVSGGVIDAGYRDEIKVLLTLNASMVSKYEHPDTGEMKWGYLIKAGDKIAQMIPMLVLTMFPVEEVEDLGESSRGTGGFGSTGK